MNSRTTTIVGAAVGGVLIIGTLIFVVVRRGSEPPASGTASSPATSSPKVAEIKIGTDYFSRGDLLHLATLYFPKEEYSRFTESQHVQLRERARDRSVVIQEAARQNLVPVDMVIYNPNKNWGEYNKTYEKAKEAILAQEERITVGGVFMFFQNQVPPKMGVEAAKKLTREKMERIHADLTSGRLNLESAAERIKRDTSLAVIDPIYKVNAYFIFGEKNRSGPVVPGITAEENSMLWSMEKGAYTPILLGKESGNYPEPNEAYWGIFQVHDKKGTAKPFEEWLTETSRNYAIEIL